MKQQQLKRVLDQIQPRKELEQEIFQLLNGQKKRQSFDRKKIAVLVAAAAVLAAVVLPKMDVWQFSPLSGLEQQFDRSVITSTAENRLQKQEVQQDDSDMPLLSETEQPEMAQAETALSDEQKTIDPGEFAGTEVVTYDAAANRLLLDDGENQIEIDTEGAVFVAYQHGGWQEGRLPKQGDRILRIEGIYRADGNYQAVRVQLESSEQTK